MPQAIHADDISTHPAPVRVVATDAAGAFDDALEHAIGQVAAAGIGGPSSTAVGKTQDLRPAAQESAKPRKDGAAKPKNLTQLSVAELASLPDATSVARAQLENPTSTPDATPDKPSTTTKTHQDVTGTSKTDIEARSNAPSAPARADGDQTAGGNPNDGSAKPEPGPARAAAAEQNPELRQSLNQNHAESQAAAISAAPPSSASGATGDNAGAGVGPVSLLQSTNEATGPEPAVGATQPVTDIKTITGAKSKALLATLESSSRGKFVVEDHEPLTQVSRGLSLALRQGGNATLRLAPDSLGELTIHLNIKDDQVSARLQPTTESARHLLEAKSHELWAALEARGLSVERIEIDGSRIGQEFGALSQDANNAPKDRSGGEPARRGNGAEPRAIDVDSFGAELGQSPVSFGHDSASVYRLRLDAIA
ncbi:MAG: flagellar hook-length control protein FliK [Phycisphaerales bacterium]|jgi:flagellar hook-length control protein FliK